MGMAKLNVWISGMFELAYLDEIDELVQNSQPQKDQLEVLRTTPPVAL